MREEEREKGERRLFWIHARVRRSTQVPYRAQVPTWVPGGEQCHVGAVPVTTGLTAVTPRGILVK